MSTNPMVNVRIGDRDHFVDAAVARELEYQRGRAAGFGAIAKGAVQPTSGTTTSHLSDREVFAADRARRLGPSTAYGGYVKRLSEAHRADRHR